MVNGIGLNSYGLSALLTQTTGADVDEKAKAAAGGYRHECRRAAGCGLDARVL